ncbi:chromate transporter [Tuanshanicoccus lijuaniae]|uniref:chromate transporter n=1 Tax=Aerococcaceae bacterium zg-1292 TaxID=2774330 RepID=UPI001BD8F31D|nr:chromate transporter [Aerococcaceae bacterium zg-A91]MBS4457523.1 chromate transporter [Aerococcaceae bacterium zg-BR33]
MIYLKLFWAFFKIGLFSIGGGYAAMPLIQQQTIDSYHWLTMAQFGDITTIAEMTPGPIALNAATFVGIQVAGIPGAIIATLGCILPSSIIVMIFAYLYYRYRGFSIVNGVLLGLRPAVIAMIASAGISLFSMAIFNQQRVPQSFTPIDLQNALIFFMALLLLRLTKLSPIHVMVLSGLIGVVLSLI